LRTHNVANEKQQDNKLKTEKQQI